MSYQSNTHQDSGNTNDSNTNPMVSEHTATIGEDRGAVARPVESTTSTIEQQSNMGSLSTQSGATEGFSGTPSGTGISTGLTRTQSQATHHRNETYQDDMSINPSFIRREQQSLSDDETTIRSRKLQTRSFNQDQWTIPHYNYGTTNNNENDASQNPTGERATPLENNGNYTNEYGRATPPRNNGNNDETRSGAVDSNLRSRRREERVVPHRVGGRESPVLTTNSKGEQRVIAPILADPENRSAKRRERRLSYGEATYHDYQEPLSARPKSRERQNLTQDELKQALEALRTSEHQLLNEESDVKLPVTIAGVDEWNNPSFIDEEIASGLVGLSSETTAVPSTFPPDSNPRRNEEIQDQIEEIHSILDNLGNDINSRDVEIRAFIIGETDKVYGETEGLVTTVETRLNTTLNTQYDQLRAKLSNTDEEELNYRTAIGKMIEDVQDRIRVLEQQGPGQVNDRDDRQQSAALEAVRAATHAIKTATETRDEIRQLQKRVTRAEEWQDQRTGQLSSGRPESAVNQRVKDFIDTSLKAAEDKLTEKVRNAEEYFQNKILKLAGRKGMDVRAQTETLSAHEEAITGLQRDMLTLEDRLHKLREDVRGEETLYSSTEEEEEEDAGVTRSLRRESTNRIIADGIDTRQALIGALQRETQGFKKNRERGRESDPINLDEDEVDPFAQPSRKDKQEARKDGVSIQKSRRLPGQHMVRALRDFKAGAILGTYMAGTEYTEGTDNRYTIMVGDRVLDGKRTEGWVKFVNHSCDPNCKLVEGMTSLPFPALITTVEVKKGEPITFDYGWTVPYGEERTVCVCKTGKKDRGKTLCKGYIENFEDTTTEEEQEEEVKRPRKKKESSREKNVVGSSKRKSTIPDPPLQEEEENSDVDYLFNDPEDEEDGPEPIRLGGRRETKTQVEQRATIPTPQRYMTPAPAIQPTSNYALLPQTPGLPPPTPWPVMTPAQPASKQELPKFKGQKPGQPSARAWLRDYEELGNSKFWNGDIHLRTVTQALEDVQTKNWHRKLLEQKPSMTWNEWKAAFVQKFTDSQDEMRIQGEFEELRQGHNESMSKYIDRFSDVCNRYEEITNKRNIPENWEERKKNKFVHSVHVEYRSMMEVVVSTMNLEQLYKHARKQEDYSKERTASARRTVRVLSRIGNEAEQPPVTSEATPNSSQSVYRKCMACGSREHSRRDCKLAANLTCSYCKRNGHAEIVCGIKSRAMRDRPGPSWNQQQQRKRSFVPKDAAKADSSAEQQRGQ